MVRSAALILLSLSLPACHRDPPPPAAPSDAGAEAAVEAPEDSGPDVAQVFDQGQEPRAPLTFTFVPGRVEGRVLEIDSRFEIGGRPRMEERVELRFELRYEADSIELLLRHAETTAPDIPAIASTVGASFKQRFGKDGTTDPPVAVFPPGAGGTAKQYVEGAVTQVASVLLPACPSTPLGEGARWRWGKADGPRYQIVSRHDGQVVVERTTEIHGSRRLGSLKMGDVNEDQRTRIEAPLDGIARHVESTLSAEKKKGTKRITQMRFDVIDKP